ncbi:MAG: hypothetical protein CH6_2507 [Candidatus Kapaibacterium sp.]|nr:MAG: hypothetical protein CH6_2507 [Candidatus Kapabacteria bacterium]
MKKVSILLILFLESIINLNSKYYLLKIFLEQENDYQKLLSLNLDMESATYGKSEITIIVNEYEKEMIAENGFKFEPLIEDYEKHLEMKIKENVDKFKEDNLQAFEYGSMGGFYTLEEIYQQFNKLSNNPYFVEKQEIGYSWEKNPIIAYCFGSRDNNKPEVLITALHHSREPATVTTIVYFLQNLLEKAKNGDDEAVYLLENRRIWIIPVLNPDGYLYNQKSYPNGGGLWRKNRRPISQTDTGVDLNRNYGPYEFWNANNNGSSTNPKNETYRGPAPFSEPEITALRNFCFKRNFRLALNFHTYGGMLIYPYSALPFETPDSIWYRSFGAYLQPITSYYFGTDVQTVGYPTRGSSDDWFYTPDSTKGKILAFSPEASFQFDGFWPKKERILPIAKENYPLILNFLWSVEANIRLWDYFYNFDTTRKIGFLQLEFANIGLENSTNSTQVRIYSNSSDYSLDTIFELPPLQSAERFYKSIQLPIPNETFKNGSEIEFTVSVIHNNLVRKDTIKLTLYEYQIVDLKDSTLWDFSLGKWGYEILNDSNYILLCDSPYYNYKDSLDNYLVFRAPYRLGANNFELELTSRWAIEPFYDYAKVEISTNNGRDWTPLRFKRSTIASGNQYGKQKLGEFGFAGYIRFWNTQTLSLKEFLWKEILLRLSVLSDRAKNSAGWDIKDIKLRKFPNISFQNYVSTPKPINKLFLFSQGKFLQSIELTENIQIYELAIWDILGRKVFTQNYPEPNSTIYLQGITDGVYFLRLSTNEGYKNFKILVK